MVSRKAISRKIICYFAPCTLLISFVLIAGCKDKESYQKEISRRRISYSVDSFLNEAAAGNKERIELFLKAGMNVNARGNDGYTALFLASANDNVEVVKFLIHEGADVNAQGNNGYTALMVVSSKGNSSVAKLLLKKGAHIDVKNTEGETALMLASLNGNAEVAKLLIEKGADVNARSNKGMTALGYSFLDTRMSGLLRKAGAKE